MRWRRGGGNAMRLYHFLTAQNGLDDLQNRRLKISLIDRLNDPFEFLGVASKNSNIRRQYRELKAGLARSVGIICFSETTRNPVQWSHYADHHRGLCLGFEISNAVDIRKVQYVDTRLKPNPKALRSISPSAEKHVLEILTTKFTHWQYEQEWRLFTSLARTGDKGFYWYPFSEEVSLREVIVGAQSPITRLDLQAALGPQSATVKTRKARLAFQTFEVVDQKDGSFFR